AAQTVRLLRGKTGADDGDLHRLLLKQRHAHGLAQYLAQRLGWVVYRVTSRASPQIGVDHAALDRTRPHYRHLKDEVIEFARFEPWQHRHLGTAFDLKDAKRV